MDSDSLQQKALDVPEIDDSFDPNFEPQDGEEYLMKVVYERRTCPAVVVKPLKNETSININAATHITNEFNDSSPEHLKPNKIWKQMQLETFNDARQKISQLREQIAKLHTNNFNEFPLIEECDSWKIFCQENEPLTHIVLNISQRDLEKILEYQSIWLSAEDQPVELFDGGIQNVHMVN
ncbi:protein Gemin2 isoform X2 [Condylostylus longicornis]|uniref:protein Gemin2 isoform X2 n=1 Tax=Condylostylus longicornis TaxID=2530218 RepID=UPI00244E4A2A|nr:protein Gemin2 isoform X2 [Condylostylus longicornis]